MEADEELSEWCTWISVNTENEHTALWVQKKFDVPEQGHWVSENVFSIPAFDKPAVHGSPGLIVFERTPLEGVDDEIERCVSCCLAEKHDGLNPQLGNTA